MKRSLVLFIAVALYSCGEPKEEVVIEVAPMPSISVEDSMQIRTIVDDIPPSYEITALLKSSGAMFSPMVINSIENIDKYQTSMEKAMNFGVYSADYAYSIYYNEMSSSLAQMENLKKIAEDLGIAQYYNSDYAKKIFDNKERADTVLKYSKYIIAGIDEELKKNDMDKESAVMLFGSWMEAMHISTIVMYNAKVENPNLSIKVAQQKEILEKFRTLLNFYKDNEYVTDVLSKMENLDKIYTEIQYFPYEGSVNTPVDEITTTTVDSIGTAKITNTQLAQITIELSNIRKHFTKTEN